MQFPKEDRNHASVKQKFQGFYRSKVPTGNPLMPLEVKRAKEIQRKREEQMYSSGCEGIKDDEEIISKAPNNHDRQDNKDDNSNVAASSRGSRPPLLLPTIKRKHFNQEEHHGGVHRVLCLQMINDTRGAATKTSRQGQGATNKKKGRARGEKKPTAGGAGK